MRRTTRANGRMTGKTYSLLGADGACHASRTKGTLGGHRKQYVYGRLDCPTALRVLARADAPYRLHRVFFADMATAIAAGFRPCGVCMRDAYAVWKRGPQPGVPFGWRRLPPERRRTGAA